MNHSTESNKRRRRAASLSLLCWARTASTQSKITLSNQYAANVNKSRTRLNIHWKYNTHTQADIISTTSQNEKRSRLDRSVRLCLARIKWLMREPDLSIIAVFSTWNIKFIPAIPDITSHPHIHAGRIECRVRITAIHFPRNANLLLPPATHRHNRGKTPYRAAGGVRISRWALWVRAGSVNQ
jgi:hypothetical protein